MFYSKSTGGFYSAEIHSAYIPSDVVEITDVQHADLMQAQSQGALISADKAGNPIAIPPAPQSQLELMQQAINKVKFALQGTIDAKALEYGFSSGNAYMLYAGFTNPFKANALIFAQWEANVWAEAEAYKVLVLAGSAPMLLPEEAVAMIPAYPA